MREPTFEEVQAYYNFRREEQEFLEIKKIAAVFYPSATHFSASFYSEYDDEGGYYMAVESANFYDENNNELYVYDESIEDYRDEIIVSEENWPEILQKMKDVGMNTKNYRGLDHNYNTFYFDLRDSVSGIINADKEKSEVELDLREGFPTPENLARLYVNDTALRSEYASRLINSA